jgi:hypothetical protein
MTDVSEVDAAYNLFYSGAEVTGYSGTVVSCNKLSGVTFPPPKKKKSEPNLVSKS